MKVAHAVGFCRLRITIYESIEGPASRRKSNNQRRGKGEEGRGEYKKGVRGRSARAVDFYARISRELYRRVNQ